MSVYILSTYFLLYIVDSYYCICLWVIQPTSVPTSNPTSPTGIPPTNGMGRRLLVPPPPPAPSPDNQVQQRNLVEDDDGVRTIVYKCKDWPDTLYCSQNNPIQYDGRGWKAVGYCQGSRAPTGSPIQYDGTCQFNKCVLVPQGGDPEPCVIGQENCLCNGSSTCFRRPDIEVCSMKDVEPFSSSVEYVEDDVVRIGTKRFKCRSWPNSGWCSDDGYEPSLKPGLWEQAWDEDGECEIMETSNPTSNPTSQPTSNPTSKPTGFAPGFAP